MEGVKVSFPLIFRTFFTLLSTNVFGIFIPSEQGKKIRIESNVKVDVA